MRTLLCLALFLSASLYGEIVSVTVSWNNRTCQDDCTKQIEKYFKAAKEIQSVSINQASGMATLTWKPGTPFSYLPIRSVMSRIGLYMDSLRVSLKGTVSHSGKEYYITSSGDNSKFHLLGSTSTDPNRMHMQQSRYNRPLSSAQVALLQAAEKDKSIVEVKGVILQATQFPPMDLIIESLNISKSKD